MRLGFMSAVLLLTFALNGCSAKVPPPLEEQVELRESTDGGHDLRQRAISYLQREFGSDEAFDLQLLKSIDDHPLMGPGEYAIFQFDRPAESGKRYYVIVGSQGGTNYYPDLALSLDELWKVHIGTDFYLMMKVKTLSKIENAERYAKEAKEIIEKSFSVSLQSPPVVEACYQYRKEIHAVGKCRSGSTVYSFVVGDVPNFAVQKDLAADVMWRLNMGRVVSEEAAREAVKTAK